MKTKTVSYGISEDTDKKIVRLEGRISELERLLREEQARRAEATARYDGYSAAVKDLGRRDSDNSDRSTYGMFPFHPMMFRR